jgi:uncharacterized protein (TIGR03437 family)
MAVKFLKFSAALTVIPGLILAYEFGPYPGFTGAPGDNATSCITAGCHVGTVNNPANGGSVAILGSDGKTPITTYTPGGARQLITILITDANRTSWGFEMTARLASNLKAGQAGSFSDLNGGTSGAAGASVQVICATTNFAPCPANNPLQWVEHSLSGWEASVNHKGSYSYQTYWTPPSANVGNVMMYAAGNASSSINTMAASPNTGHIYNTSITLTPAASTLTPVISAGGVISAGNFGAFTSAGPGSWLEIYGTNLAATSRSWADADFGGSIAAGAKAPTTLDGVTVTVGGQFAYVSYVSPGQLNAQIPTNVGTGPQPVIVTASGVDSAPFTMTIKPLEPGLLAPPTFAVGGKQYLGSFHSDNITFVMPVGAVAGVTSSPAKPGETIIFYGVGFGAVSPASVPFAGQVVGATNSIGNFSINFGSSPGVPQYFGLAAGFVGLYQFNITVPQISNSDLVPITFRVGGTAGTQTLYTSVHN